jgi:PKD repeat protein
MGGSLPYSALDICYADQNTLYGVGTGNIISRSTNGGQSWTNIYQSTGITMGVHFANTNFGVVGGEDGKILTTNDGGANWSSFSTGYHSFYAVHVFDKDSAYVGGTDVDIYKTTDAGETWTLDYNGSGASSMYNFSFTENNTGFCSGSQGTMLRRNAPIATNFSADETEICNGNQIQFTDLSVGATNWEWYFEGGTPESSNDQNPVITYYYAGSYDVSLTASNTEQSQSIMQENYINVFDQPQPSVTGSDATCIGETTNYQTNNIVSNSYQWDVLGGEILSGQNTSEIVVSWTVEGAGYVIVHETTNSICITTDSLLVYASDCLGTDELTDSEIQIYPNPTTDNLIISLNCNESELLIFNILSPIGNKISEQQFISTTGKQKITLNLNDLKQGIYILEILKGAHIISKIKFQKIDI